MLGDDGDLKEGWNLEHLGEPTADRSATADARPGDLVAVSALITACSKGSLEVELGTQVVHVAPDRVLTHLARPRIGDRIQVDGEAMEVIHETPELHQVLRISGRRGAAAYLVMGCDKTYEHLSETGDEPLPGDIVVMEGVVRGHVDPLEVTFGDRRVIVDRDDIVAAVTLPEVGQVVILDHAALEVVAVTPDRHLVMRTPGTRDVKAYEIVAWDDHASSILRELLERHTAIGIGDAVQEDTSEHHGHMASGHAGIEIADVPDILPDYDPDSYPLDQYDLAYDPELANEIGVVELPEDEDGWDPWEDDPPSGGAGDQHDDDDAASEEDEDEDLPVFDARMRESPWAYAAPRPEVLAGAWARSPEIKAVRVANVMDPCLPKERRRRVEMLTALFEGYEGSGTYQVWVRLAPALTCADEIALVIALRVHWDNTPSLWLIKRSGIIETDETSGRLSWRRALHVVRHATHDSPEHMVDEAWHAEWLSHAHRAFSSFAAYVAWRCAPQPCGHSMITIGDLSEARPNRRISVPRRQQGHWIDAWVRRKMHIGLVR